MGWCTQYQLDPFDRIQNRAVRIVEDPIICERLDTLALRRDVSLLCILYSIYDGECFKEMFDLLPTAEFSNRTVRHNLKHHPQHLLNYLPAAIFPGRYDLGILKAGNAPVSPLLLHGFMGGGNHLLSCNPYARLLYFFSMKNTL